MTEINVTNRGEVETALGVATYIKVFTDDYQKLGWEDVWRAFSQHFPDRWAVEIYPPESELVNGKNVYHLFVLPDEPKGFNIRRPL